MKTVTSKRKTKKARLGKSFNKKSGSKVRGGQYVRSIPRQLIIEKDTFLWLSRRDQKAETDSKIIAAKDKALQTKYHATKILQTETDNKCRLCQLFDKTTDHTLSACPILAKQQYIKRNNAVCAQVHFNICKEIWVKLDNEH
jgi:hypothetical protein